MVPVVAGDHVNPFEEYATDPDDPTETQALDLQEIA